MELRECDISLKTVRAYRDCVEVLLLAKPINNLHGDQNSSSGSVEAWSVNLGDLSKAERNSLKVLSPNVSMLHLEWIDQERLENSRLSLNATDPVKPLSLPPPKQSLRPSSQQTLVTAPPQNRKDKFEGQKIDPNEVIVLPAEIRDRTLAFISSEKEKYAQETPTSVEEIKRRLEITGTLAELETRWQREKGHLLPEAFDQTLSQAKTLQSLSKSSEQECATSSPQTLCLYFQQTESSSERSPLPSALHGGWIDSINPREMNDEDEEESFSPLSLPKDVSAQSSPPVWLRLVLSKAYWTPSVHLSLHGDMGRLSVFSHLNSSGLSQLIEHSSHMNLTHEFQENTEVSKADTIHEAEMVKVEWIDDYFLTHQQLNVKEIQTRHSNLSLDELRRDDAQHQPSICFESIMLMSRTLRDFEGERERIQSTDQRTSFTNDMIENVSETHHLEIGYFTEYIQYRYPPALVAGREKALRGQRKLKLCLPPLSPFLSSLLDVKDEQGAEWLLLLEGLPQKRSPNNERHHVINFDLGEVQEVIATRKEQGLSFISHLTHVCRVGVMTIDGSSLIDELELQPLGVGTLKQLEQTLSAMSQSKEVSS